MTIAARYAQCLYQLARQSNVLDRVYEDVCMLTKTFTQQESLSWILCNPLVSRKLKQGLLRKLFDSHVHKHMLTFLNFIIQKRRQALLLDILQVFSKLYKAYRQIQPARVTTAYPLSSELKRMFLTVVRRMTSCTDVELVTRVDPDLIGGYVLKFNSIQIDQSLRTSLKLVKRSWTSLQ